MSLGTPLYNYGDPLSSHQVIRGKSWAITVKVNQNIVLLFKKIVLFGCRIEELTERCDRCKISFLDIFQGL